MKRTCEIQVVVAFKVEQRVSIVFLFFQEILSVAKKSKVENQVCWHMLLQFNCVEPEGREDFSGK